MTLLDERQAQLREMIEDKESQCPGKYYVLTCYPGIWKWEKHSEHETRQAALEEKERLIRTGAVVPACVKAIAVFGI